MKKGVSGKASRAGRSRRNTSPDADGWMVATSPFRRLNLTPLQRHLLANHLLAFRKSSSRLKLSELSVRLKIIVD